jgi:hypothetical protein
MRDNPADAEHVKARKTRYQHRFSGLTAQNTPMETTALIARIDFLATPRIRTPDARVVPRFEYPEGCGERTIREIVADPNSRLSDFSEGMTVMEAQQN